MIMDNATIRGVALAFDGDRAGMLAGLTWQKVLRDKKLIKVLQLPSNKDVNDLSKRNSKK